MIDDRSISDADFANDFLAGRSRKTARRRILADGIPYQKDGSRWLLKLSDCLAWRESKMTTPETPSLKSVLAEIAAKALAARRPA